MAVSSNRRPSVSIRHAIPALFIALIVATVGLTGWLAFRSGKQSVEELATRLGRETTARIEEHTHTFLGTSHLLHQVNVAAVHTGNLDLSDAEELERYFLQQVQLTESVPFIYFGSEQGTFMGIQREVDGSLVLWELDESTAPKMDIYRLDDQHNPAQLLDSVDFDPRVRPWYKAAVEAGSSAWSPIYPDISRPILIITSVMPVYDEGGALQGVLGIELSLAQISDFLHSLEISQSGQAFIIEQSGEIVASSASEPPYVVVEGEQQRLKATDSSEPLIRDAARYLLDESGGFDRIDGDQQFIARMGGRRHFLQVTPLQGGQSPDWLIVVVIPEADFMGPIYDNVRSTALLGAFVLVVAALLGLVIARWIIRPILAITRAAASVEAGEFVVESLDAVTDRGDELGQLARVFRRMAREVYTREQRLKREVQQLRIKVDAAKRQQQVDAIVETDFFRDLEAKAHNMRRRSERRADDTSDDEPQVLT
jgi:HAMP domain-containing protein